MRKLVLFTAFVLVPAFSRAGGLDLNIGKTGFSVGISTSLNDAYTVGGWDFSNREPIAGYGKELFPVKHNGTEVAYVAGTHLFAVGEAGRGAFGLAVGVRPVTLLNQAGRAVGAASNIISLPQWASAIADFVSIEGGYARRGIFGDRVTDGRKADLFAIQGQLRVPVSDFIGLFTVNKSTP